MNEFNRLDSHKENKGVKVAEYILQLINDMSKQYMYDFVDRFLSENCGLAKKICTDDNQTSLRHDYLRWMTVAAHLY